MTSIKQTLLDLKKNARKTIVDLQRLINENDLYLNFYSELEISYDGLSEKDSNVFVVVTADRYIVGIGQKSEIDNLFAEVRRKITDMENGRFKSIGKLEVKK